MELGAERNTHNVEQRSGPRTPKWVLLSGIPKSYNDSLWAKGRLALSHRGIFIPQPLQ